MGENQDQISQYAITQVTNGWELTIQYQNGDVAVFVVEGEHDVALVRLVDEYLSPRDFKKEPVTVEKKKLINVRFVKDDKPFEEEKL